MPTERPPFLRVRHRHHFRTGEHFARSSHLEPWIEQPLDSDWTVCFRVAIEGNHCSISEVRIIPSEERWNDGADDYEAGVWSAEHDGRMRSFPKGGVRSKHLRAVHFPSVDSIAEIAQWYHDNLPDSLSTLATLGITPDVALKKRGPVGKSDLHLAELASEYLVAVARGVPAHPTIAQRHRYNTDWARDSVKEARTRQLLTSLGSGKAGGRLTQMAMTLLHEAALKGPR
jgi:hypothetical protein